MVPNTFQVIVTADHIQVHSRSCSDCPIALAIAEQTRLGDIAVYIHHSRLYGPIQVYATGIDSEGEEIDVTYQLDHVSRGIVESFDRREFIHLKRDLLPATIEATRIPE